ncbi:hypothetical protein Poli38472_013110 [Pythium oligandrum]|uniref:ABC transporter domain-containing protein n=1 Tax=Pythium oligandrum TaxID=41045 RepID=A0A8K1C2H9_PYTOL|nr:hypothetical protein Poli38472_013110 [Pythium oligandrum]|eukprot:TMW55219.1 hypothetical protein Poli38472_013110 [Pythium oligandrum]
MSRRPNDEVRPVETSDLDAALAGVMGLPELILRASIIEDDDGDEQDTTEDPPIAGSAQARLRPRQGSSLNVVDETRDVVPEIDHTVRPERPERPDRAEARMSMKMKSTMLERYSSLDATTLESMLSGGLDRFFGKFKNAWKKHNLSFPTPEITFENLSYEVRMSTEPSSSAGSIGGFLRAAVKPWRKLKKEKKTILHPMTGCIRPGTMTLVLANPGAGKSTFLKALAGKLSTRRRRRFIKGSITYSGLAAEEIQIDKLVGLVDQADNHLPTLTVRETLEFADRCLNGFPEDKPEKLREIARLRTDLCMHILGLTKCADTVVGDALLRGVSGGERKRVTIGEMIVGHQSVFLCDEISTGLDSAATFDITQSLKSFTRTLGGSVVIALLQPPPEVVELFDDVLILAEGRLVYHGPTIEMLSYFESLGFGCPERVDPAEFAVDVVSGRGAQYLMSDRVAAMPAKPPRLAEHFEDAFRRSERYLTTLRTLESKKRHMAKVQNETALQSVQHLISKHEGGNRPTYGMGFFESTAYLFQRQKKIWMRDRALVLGKMIEAVVVGLLLGIIYYNVSSMNYLRMIFFSAAVFQRQAWQQLPIAFQVRNVFYKQRSRMFFRTLSYTLAESIVQIPLNVMVSFILSVIFYFMSGLSRSASTFFVFYAIVVTFQHAVTAYYTLLAAFSPTITVAQSIASLSVSFFLLFSGNIILPLLIPTYWRWMYWFNPLAWALRALLLNEFHDSRYSDAERIAALARFQITKGPEFIWIGILVLAAYYVLFTLLNTAGLHWLRFEVQATASVSTSSMEESYPDQTTASASPQSDVQPSVIAGGGAVVTPTPESPDHLIVPMAAKPTLGPEASRMESGDTPAAVTCIPAYLVVRNLEYFVPHPAQKGEELQLLHGITAHFTPGKMTALMGSSGAGKTTLMDVLAGRKTGGRIEGDILVNGEPKDPTTFSRIAGYCEQMDIHSGGATIQEALEFSARLRLPASTTPAERRAIVQNTMDLLELNGLALELVRNCSIEQKKRITIGVEVVANPSILFLDEPTSGLDARAASFVMKGVRSIARTGRTVLCTIHQPSVQIFELFDSLLLLQKGGYTAFFGDLGQGSELLLQYFASLPGTPSMPALYNPATYMLEVIGAGIGRQGAGQARDYSLEYKKSPLCESNRVVSEAIATGNVPPEFMWLNDPTSTKPTEPAQSALTKFSSLELMPIASSFYVQFRSCAAKMRLTYWRNPQYNLVRIVTFPLYAVIFGTTFYQMEETTMAKVNSHVGLMYNTLDFIGVINLMTVLDTVVNERAVFYRERMSNYYGPLSYALSLWLAEIPYLLFVSIVFMAIEYFLIGWESDASGFFLFWFVFFLHISISTSIGQFMSVLMPNIKVANVAVGAISVLFNLFSGFLMPHQDMRKFYSWIRWLTVTNYSLPSLVSIEMGRCTSEDLVSKIHGCRIVAIPATGETPATAMRLTAFIYKYFHFDYADLWWNIVVLISIWVILQIAIYLTLRFVSHLKR